MEKGLITLIVPCYNVGKTLERFLQSVLKQTYRHIQIVFIDDGSTDNTATILKKYQPIFSSAKMKMQYIYQKNAGLGSAINTGLKYIEGEYLCWADPDDFYMKDSMKITVKYQFVYMLLMQVAASGVAFVFGLVAFWYFLSMNIAKEIISVIFIGVNFAMLYIPAKNFAIRDNKS